MSTQYEIFNNTRKVVINKIRMSIDDRQWSENIKFVELLKETIIKHPVNTHPMIDRLDSGAVNKESLAKINLEYRHAIAQIFTDALLMAQYQARHLEQRLAPGAKSYPRFILGLKVFDEFKFNANSLNDLANPEQGYYPLFEKILDKLDVGSIARKVYMPSKAAKKVRHYLEDSFYDYTSTIALLAVVEVMAMSFRKSLYNAFNALQLNVDELCKDKLINNVYALDQDQENDLWLALAQACTKEEFISIYELCLKYCELWEKFWDVQLDHTK